MKKPGIYRGVFFLLVLVVTLSPAQATSVTYYDDHRRGWFWYEKEPPPKAPTPKKTVAAKPSAPALSPRERLKKQGEAWEDALALAILEPSPDHYLAYLQKTAAIQAQAQHFAAGFKKTLWITPELDYTLEKPRDTQAIIGMNEQRNQQEDAFLKETARDNGILFFFRSDCPHCHRFAPILKLFANTYGFSVIAISLDGKGLPEYPYPKSDHELASRLNIATVPALFMVNPDNNAIATIGYGFNHWVNLKKKVLFAARQLTGTARKERNP